MRPFPIRFLLLSALLWTTACGDDPFQIRWEENPLEVTLYAVSRPELNLPTAFNFVSRRAIPLEAPDAAGRWDVAVEVEDGGMVLLTPGALGIRSRAAVAPMPGMTFQEIREAPADTARYIGDRPVPIQVGATYVVRTHEEAGSFGAVCVYYAKLEPRRVDPQDGVVVFLFDSSPVCNNRSLVPPRR